MGSMQVDDELAPEFDDSGCVQDETFTLKGGGDNERCDSVQILDLSDDVLLYILAHCSPQDLKALGFSCSRFARLVLERSLWRNVDSRGQPSGKARFRWFVTHALHADTTDLMVAGYAKEAAGCLGTLNSASKNDDKDMDSQGMYGWPRPDSNPDLGLAQFGEIQLCTSAGRLHRRHHALFHISVHQLPRFSGSPSWPEDADNEDEELKAQDFLLTDGEGEGTCTGPRFTLSSGLLMQLQQTCPNLTTLGLEFCNINCKNTGIGQFPSTLKTLSLRGSKCFNLPMDKSFFFKIQDHLPLLETLDVSECEWLEPSSLMPLSKLRVLRRLLASGCIRMTEFVAYASLAMRYGFRELMELDLRGCPVGDSEVSALGWLPVLQVLRLAAAAVVVPPMTHRHTKAITTNISSALDSWELQEPEFFKSKYPEDEQIDTDLRMGQEIDLNTGEIIQKKQTPSTSLSEENKAETAKPSQSSSRDASQTEERNATKRKPNKGSSVNDEGPSCSKRKRTEKEDRDTSDSDSDDKDDGIITVVRRGNRLETEKKTKGKKSKNKSAVMKIVGVVRENNKEEKEQKPKSKSKAEKNVNDGASTSRDKSRKIPGIICIQGNREPVVLESIPPAQPAMQPDQINRAMYLSQIMYSFPNVHFPPERGNNSPLHLDSSSLVSDASVRRFGRANDEDINYINIGPNGPVIDSTSRPDRSNLRRLSMVGYRHITNRSLVHLATAAPFLEFVDFRGTNVNCQGVVIFKIIRPDCEVLYGELNE
ncbi:uncharacterized protein [Battus philenor]|uniref:uncharacterized protein n=1 Tax=Battus philenor TaxID=42288 RepID=UPI0035D1248E